ncbi:MAG TPA: hypothetical protein VGK13_01300 [Methanocellaceae archaeon]
MGLLEEIVKKVAEKEKTGKEKIKIVPPQKSGQEDIKIVPPQSSKQDDVVIVPPQKPGQEEITIMPPTHEQAEAQPLTNTFHGHTFQHTNKDPPAVWFNESERIVYISDPDSFVKSGGKIENRPVTSAMDAQMYQVYSQHGQEQQVLYYKPENKLISLVADPFAKYRPVDKSADPKYKYRVIAAFQRMTGTEVYGNKYDEIIIPELRKRGMSTDELIQKYGKPGD